MSNIETDVIVIGGGATGTGILRDLCLRGLKAILLEQGDLGSGTSSRFHGLLHSGARYAVGDTEAAHECATENKVLRHIAPFCVEATEGWFVLTEADDPGFENTWLDACHSCGIKTEPLSIADALRLSPNLTTKVKAVYRVPDAAVDGFRVVWQNAMSAKNHGGQIFTYMLVTGFRLENGRVTAVLAKNKITGKDTVFECRYAINATGSWAGETASLADLKVPVLPDRGLLLAFNHRFTDRIINRLRRASDGDIFVPHGSITIFGTTSIPVERPNDTRALFSEATKLLGEGEAVFPRLRQYRILRAFAGTRPLYAPNASSGRKTTRNFVILDHLEEGLEGLVTITGGKFTSFRLMAEKVSDLVAKRLGNTSPCHTATTPLVAEPSPEQKRRAIKYFPFGNLGIATARLGPSLEMTLSALEKSPLKKILLCECELVTLAEFELVASENTSHHLNDIRRRTRMGMGTCQGNFCTMRSAGALAETGLFKSQHPLEVIRSFLQERWHGIRPVLWGNQLRGVELERGIFGATLNINGQDAISCPAPLPTTKTNRPVFNRSTETDLLAEATYDVIVVGSGMAGLTAAAAAASHGFKTLVVSRGAGALTIGGGTVDLLGYIQGQPVTGNPFEAFSELPANHPYTLLGPKLVAEAMDFIVDLIGESLERSGQPQRNSWLPTAAGTLKPTWLTGPSMNPAALDNNDILVAGVTGFKDFSPTLISMGLSREKTMSGKNIDKILFPAPPIINHGGRDCSSYDLARFLETELGKSWLTTELLKISGKKTVLMPPILGTLNHYQLHRELEAMTGLSLLELYSLPPGITGLRLYYAMRRALKNLGVLMFDNVEITGAIVEDEHCLGLTLGGKSPQRMFRANSFIIATGGLFGKGLSTEPGLAEEAIFKLPVPVWEDQEKWSEQKLFSGSHNFAIMGVQVDEKLRPIHQDKVILDNVHFAGRILGGYDFVSEKSGNGVAVATGYACGNLL